MVPAGLAVARRRGGAGRGQAGNLLATRCPAGLLLLALALTACAEQPGDPAAQPGALEGVAATGQLEATPETPVLPPPDDGDRLVEAHHRLSVSGDVAGARRLLREIVDRGGARRSLRALAALRLAGIEEVTGDRRAALSELDKVSLLAGSGHPLTMEADDRRARIRTATPLADVRGPVPGTALLRGEAAPVLAQFRRAEQLLASYHRIVVAPSLENMTEVLRTKRRALTAAVSAYQKLTTLGGDAARAAAAFRTGAMYHHLAEALAFETPEELLLSEARRVSRELRAERAAYLRRALSSYRTVLRLPAGPATSPWQPLARREAETLQLVLRGAAKRSGR